MAQGAPNWRLCLWGGGRASPAWSWHISSGAPPLRRPHGPSLGKGLGCWNMWWCGQPSGTRSQTAAWTQLRWSAWPPQLWDNNINLSSSTSIVSVGLVVQSRGLSWVCCAEYLCLCCLAGPALAGLALVTRQTGQTECCLNAMVDGSTYQKVKPISFNMD